MFALILMKMGAGHMNGGYITECFLTVVMTIAVESFQRASEHLLRREVDEWCMYKKSFHNHKTYE